MQRGIIFDTYIDTAKDVIVSWLISSDKAFRIEEKYSPNFYVFSERKKLYKLAAQLQDDYKVKYLNFKLSKLYITEDKEKLVLEVIPRNIYYFRQLADEIDKTGNYQDYQLFNVDIRIPTRYLIDRGIFCNALVSWDSRRFLLEDEKWSTNYFYPFFKTIKLEIFINSKSKLYNGQIKKICINDLCIKEENETDTILSAVRCINRIDPDIIYTDNGDGFLFPHLYHRGKILGISKAINFGRDKCGKTTPSKQAKSYFSYGQIVYKPAFYTLKGRAHIDTHNSFFYTESTLRGMYDVSRISCIPLQLLSRLGPGTAISQIQVNRALEKGFLIPWKKNKPENCKTARQLLVTDRGGLILSPTVGIHNDVVELDYASLYPNIMLRYNISPETVLCRCCKNSSIKVPQLNYNICNKKIGLLPEVLKPIVERRFCFKARAKNKRYNNKTYVNMQKAWKWILIVCFGYTGYKNARFGRIECHESITAFARDILLEAKNVAEKNGYMVLHGIIDSLWVKPIKEYVNPNKLSKLIGEKTAVKMDVEGIYKWIVLLPNKQYDVGALTRYYGVFKNGEMKIRGIEARQRNTPEFVKETQIGMLEILKKAGNKEEFEERIPECIETLVNYAAKVIHNEIQPSKLLLKNRVSKDITSYKVNNLVKSCLMQLRDNDVNIEPGQYVKYIVTNEKSKQYKERVKISELIENEENIDVQYYLRQLAKCGESILIPFGYNIKKLQGIIQKIKRDGI